MGYNSNTCNKQIEDKGRTPCDHLNLPYHCDTLTGVGGDYHQECVDAGLIYFQVRVADCHNKKTGEDKYFSPDDFFSGCGALQQQDPNWEMNWCYCCCACFAKDTLISTPKGLAEIYTIPPKAEVYAGYIGVDDLSKIDWKSEEVELSMGTGDGLQPFMVYIGFDSENQKDLICTQDQPLLLSNGKFITAGKLQVGDKLVDKDGKSVELKFVSLGSYNGGVHHISTKVAWDNSPNGHLLLAQGIIAGDYKMQLSFDSLPDDMKVDNYNQLHTIGTQEYTAQNSGKVNVSKTHLQFTHSTAVGPNAGKKRIGEGIFETYQSKTSNIPLSAQSLFTEAQAMDILTKSKLTSLSDPNPKIDFDSVTKMLTGFYPDINFAMDMFNLVPNVYAFEEYGKNFVLVTGGLLRLVGFNYEGLLTAVGHGIGCFYGGEPLVQSGYSSVGKADMYSFGIITSKVWLGDPAFSYISASINQWKALFDLISPENAKGNPMDPLNDPSIECRTKIITSAPFGGALPACAGGTPLPKIELQDAQEKEIGHVELILSLAVDPDTANDIKNYEISPEAQITKAQRSSEKDFVIDLDIELEPDTKYTIKIKNLISVLNTTVDPEHDSTEFTSLPNS